jgi:hydrogenase maturation protease
MSSSVPDILRREIRKASGLRTLVIGYGNELRQDDGAGPAVARLIGEMELPGVTVEACHQLLPEHAAQIATADRVIFVDATRDGTDEISVRRIDPSRTPDFSGHHCDPQELLYWCGEFTAEVPEAWFVHIPGADFGIGEGLSMHAGNHVQSAVASILGLIGESAR